MSDNRISMRKLQDILQMRFEYKLSIRQISRSARVSVGTVSNYIKAFETAGLTWPLQDGFTEVDLIKALFPEASLPSRKGLVDPDWTYVHKELKKKGVTKQLLWEEYSQEQTLGAYSYAQYCHRYNQWRGTLKRSMRQHHKAGEKMFVDYAGPTIPLVDPHTGEMAHRAQIFVAVLGASSYTFAEATLSQKSEDWNGSHTRAFAFFGGLPEVVVPDNLKSGVKTACYYDPDLNPSYQHLANHYQVAVIPARPYKPKDKSKAEVGVQVVERWIMARLRHETFFTLAELNARIRELLTDLNLRPFKKLQGTRRSHFEQLDEPVLRPLPRQPFVHAAFRKARVHIDYHVQFDGHCYSVPHQLVRKEIEIQATENCITASHKGQVVACHARKHIAGHTTLSAHMPERHRHHKEWSPERLLGWAKDIGPDAHWLTQHMLDSRVHPEQAYRACLGLLNLNKKYGAERLNNACHRARHIGAYRLKSIRTILENGQDRIPVANTSEQTTLPLTPAHENVRGAGCFE